MSRPAPICKTCGAAHFNFQQHVEAAPAPVNTGPLMVVRRPREGYKDRADLLQPGTVRMGQTTFAKRREPGERHGAFRPAA